MKKGVVTNKVAKNRIELAGARFGRLVALAPITELDKPLKYECRCDCGALTVAWAQSLRTGHTKSCGCLSREATGTRSKSHGMSKTPIHNLWNAMLQRCQNPNVRAYADYGARGITVCERWQVFENFLEDMGLPKPGMTLERQNNDLGYSKENCVWATKTMQANNRRSSKVIEFHGKRLTQSEWETELGLRRGQIYDRLSKGWSIERTLLTPRGTVGGFRQGSGRKSTK